MLNDLNDLQESDENVWHINLCFEVETRSEESGELIQRKYTFNYAKEWDKWTFGHFHEERTPDGGRVSDRDWTLTRDVHWNDVGELDTIDVPPEVAESLAEATGAEEIVLQVPACGLNNEYEVVKKVDNTDDNTE